MPRLKAGGTIVRTMIERPMRKTIRLAEYSYRTPGSYFVTICCGQRQALFRDEAIRRIVMACWDELPSHFTGVELGEFVVMPNHVHSIITLTNPASAQSDPNLLPKL